MADSDTTQQVDLKKLLAEADAIIANIRQELAESEAGEAERGAEREAKREANKKVLAEARAIFANGQLKRAEREAEREANKRVLAEARAIFANGQLKRAEREAEREANKKVLAEARAISANSQPEREAASLSTMAEMACASFLVSSLAAKALF